MYKIIYDRLLLIDKIKPHMYFLLLDDWCILYIYKNLIIENKFLSTEEKSSLINSIILIQQYFYKFQHLKNIIYNKQYIKSSINEYDIGLNLLSEYTITNKITIIEDNSYFTFFLPDLIKIMCNSLLYHNNLFGEPIIPKNPYTSIPFSENNLYNIYFKLLDSNILIPNIINLYFKSNFNIKQFYIENETLLRDLQIKSYFTNMNLDNKYNYIIEMLKVYKHCNISIHPKYNKKEVLDKLGPILYNYGIAEYSFNPTKKIYSKNKVIKFLKQFHRENPLFGRIYYKKSSIF